ncbi:uncharacterized protein LOC121967320 [Zingiber officinale]|uniref:uncharacterized protein LOC121967320 n=1 Tax=Zingiber officinale TaxID=94328 RepID=UPI001C4AC1BC|nr:uncharacterized protein LOC121967320 [Zingiber officinale]
MAVTILDWGSTEGAELELRLGGQGIGSQSNLIQRQNNGLFYFSSHKRSILEKKLMRCDRSWQNVYKIIFMSRCVQVYVSSLSLARSNFLLLWNPLSAMLVSFFLHSHIFNGLAMDIVSLSYVSWKVSDKLNFQIQ